jgi:hypothetical protein
MASKSLPSVAIWEGSEWRSSYMGLFHREVLVYCKENIHFLWINLVICECTICILINKHMNAWCISRCRFITTNQFPSILKAATWPSEAQFYLENLVRKCWELGAAQSSSVSPFSPKSLFTWNFTKWHDLIVSWHNAPWLGNLDHQLTNELVNRGLLGTPYHLIHTYINVSD